VVDDIVWRASCGHCRWAESWDSRSNAQDAATWHVFEQHREAWLDAVGNRPPVEPDPRKVGLARIPAPGDGVSQRLDDADAVFDARLHAEGKHTHRPKGRTQDYADLMAQLVMEAGMAAEHLATEGGLPIDEYFTDAFLSGVAAAHAEGLGWGGMGARAARDPGHQPRHPAGRRAAHRRW
jgi:hypothetical protein